MPAVPPNPPLHSKRQQSVLDQSQMIDDARRIAAKPMAVMPVDVANRDVVRKAHGLPSAASVAAAGTPGVRGIVIEKGIPIPTKGWRGGIGMPFAAMDVGDSFFVMTSGAGVYFAVKKAKASTPGRDFAVRKVEENGAKGYRIWRTA